MNTIVYAEEWTIKAQERLSENNKWKEICNVEYTNDRVLHNPYITEPTVQTTARGSAYTHQNVVITDESITINGIGIIPQLIDRADLAQQTFVKQMDLADKQAILLNEAIETAMLAAHGQWTNFTNASIGGPAGVITVTSSNIDDIIRGIKREIREANGDSLLERNGGFIVWRPADFELLEAYMQANGFVTSDSALRNGGKSGLEYMGMTHYSSNKIAAGHLFAGVKKQFHLGIVKETYGQVVVDSEPATADGAMSAVAVIMRVDYAFKAWANTVPVLFDVTVA
jgi:hypothetical protein